MIAYPIGASGQQLVLSSAVLRHFCRNRQSGWRREAGGQLFARFNETQIFVEEATGPRWTDHRTWNAYIPDRRAEQTEIYARHPFGLHFIGDWHTHPEARPRASIRDLASIAESVRRSTHQLGGFVLVIVGTARLPDGLYVSVHDGNREFPLSPALVSKASTSADA